MLSYVGGIYFVSITVITIGFGDIHPVNSKERIFVIVMCLLACGVFAYSLNRIGDIISNISKKQRQFKRQMTVLSTHMVKRGLS